MVPDRPGSCRHAGQLQAVPGGFWTASGQISVGPYFSDMQKMIKIACSTVPDLATTLHVRQYKTLYY